MPHGVELDPVELGRIGGIRSGEVRRAKAAILEAKRAEVRALELFASKSEEVAKELLDAALGEGKWSSQSGALLDPKERIAILKTCLEYGVGRPRPMAAPAESAVEPEAESKGIAFGVRAPQAPLPDSAVEVDAQSNGQPQ